MFANERQPLLFANTTKMDASDRKRRIKGRGEKKRLSRADWIMRGEERSRLPEKRSFAARCVFCRDFFLYMHIYANICIYKYVCIYIYIYTCMYIYI
ncbi:hypothetical protein PUN28_011367 [Cardiocondyla obscurior]|uniref:Uncharacterized protein n=1 Tax=Cardiocondyla obscurior TaxID=286306 RepID=A0AAW2FIW9_9HYME